MKNVYSQILRLSQKIEDTQKIIDNKIYEFCSNANDLSNLSKGIYQIEKSLKLNKISLKGYILDAPQCKEFNQKQNYTVNVLKQFFKDYEKNNNENCSNYLLALALYELIEEIESLVNIKINDEINLLIPLIPRVISIKTKTNNEYEVFYNKLKEDIDIMFQKQEISNKIYIICINALNDIFNFYLNRYPIIPNEYL